MTLPWQHTRRLLGRGLLAGVVGLCASSGCKLKEGTTAGPAKARDPLVYGPTRIPPQNVPVAEREGGTRGGSTSLPKGDPLKDRAVGGSTDKSGVGYADRPERFRGTYIPGPGSTPAALAARLDRDELKIDDAPDPRVPLRPVAGTGTRPAGEPSPNPAPADRLDDLYAELARYGVRPESRSLTEENGGFVFRAAVPVNDTGAKRQYAGLGRTAAEAVRQVLEQIESDRR